MIWRLIIFEAVALVVIAGVWLGAPLVGITSAFWRIVIILALLIPPIALFVYLYLQQRKAASGLEDAIKKQGRARAETIRPDKRAEVQALSDIFEQAISALKKSRLAQGRSALYALPWYMIIGPPAVGKSTALLHSGLKFPFTTGDRRAVKGVGGTRNCDWWFSEQAILLDTAGRYTTDEDEEEWLSFLRLLKKYRRKQPLNGLLVAFSVSDLIKASPEELEEHALQMRSRIDQVIGELELALPVYVLFTKCDLLSGFIEFFGNLSKSARGQIFGFTVPLTSAETAIDELFASEFDVISSRLRKRTIVRLASAKQSQRKEIYQFPLQFSAARDRFAAFTSQLLTHNPYMESPQLRGVYFCSGTQEGRPLDQVLAGMSRALGLRELTSQQLQQSTQKKSYFLKKVFTEVMFPDRDLAGTTASGLRRRKRLGIATLVGAALISMGIMAPSVVSFINNRSMVSTSAEVAKDSRITTPDDPRKVLDSLRALDRLGQVLDSLRLHTSEGPPWSLGLGFYQGDELLPRVEKVFTRRMHQAFVLPTGTEIEATLIDIASAPESPSAGASADFDLLKTYLMVTEPKRLEIPFAVPILLSQWKKRLHPEVAQHQELLETNAKRFLQLLQEGKAEWLEQDKEVVRKARRTLIGRDTQYQTLVANVDLTVREFTLRDALRGRIQTAISATETVPGVYTRRAWNDHIRKRLAKQLVSGGSADAWVLGEEEGKDAAAQLKERYLERYVAAWQRFMRGLSLTPAGSPEESLQLLEKLTDPPALYLELFESVAYNTQLPLTDEKDAKLLKQASRMARGKAGRALRGAQRAGLDKALTKGELNRAERAFLPLHELVSDVSLVDGRPQISGLKQYLTQLEQVRAELAKEIRGQPSSEGGGVDAAVEEARRVTKGLLATLPGDLRRILSPLFYSPLDIASAQASTAQANRAAAGVSDDLCPAFAERLAGRYPFGRGKEDALLQEAISFFSPNGVIWTHYENNLKGQLLRKGSRFSPAPGKSVPPQVVSFFNQAWRVTQALFPQGSDRPQIRFQVRPHPARLEPGSTFQVSEIQLEVEGKTETYRNGPSEQWTFEWTGAPKRSSLVVRGSGGLYKKLTFSGEWSLLRLIDRAKAKKRGSWYSVEWTTENGKIHIPMEFRPERTFNPLFTRLELPCR